MRMPYKIEPFSMSAANTFRIYKVISCSHMAWEFHIERFFHEQHGDFLYKLYAIGEITDDGALERDCLGNFLTLDNATERADLHAASEGKRIKGRAWRSRPQPI